MTTPTGVLFYDGRAKPLSATGVFQPGCQLFFYQTGTLTAANVYADGGLTTPLSQPIIAASDGRFVPIYLDPSVIYRYQLYDGVTLPLPGTLLEDVDPFVAGPNLSNFVTNAALAANLANYVLSTALAATLTAYESIDNAAATYMPLAGGTFTGVVNGVTPSPGDNSTKLATTAFVQGLGNSSGSPTSGSFQIGTTIFNFGYVGPSPGGGSSPTPQAVTFHTAFPTACAVILLTATAGATLFTSPPASSVSGFQCYNGAGGSFTSYLAIGN
jgi:hypothetical protein